MPRPIDEIFNDLEPKVSPFQRQNLRTKSKRIVDLGEDTLFEKDIIEISISENSIKDSLLLTKIKYGSSLNDLNTRYLWVINDKISIKILKEDTPNPSSNRGIVCHTNLTGGKEAYQGGELCFLSDSSILINSRSGRYGADTIVQGNAVLELFRFVGFQVKDEL